MMDVGLCVQGLALFYYLMQGQRMHSVLKKTGLIFQEFSGIFGQENISLMMMTRQLIHNSKFCIKSIFLEDSV